MQTAVALSGTMRDIPTVLIHQEPLVRRGLETLLASHEWFSRVDLLAAPDGIEEVLQYIKSSVPRVVIVTLPLPAPWQAVIAMVRHACPTVRILVLTPELNPEIIAATEREGAAGCLSLTVSPQEFGKGITAVADAPAVSFTRPANVSAPCGCSGRVLLPRDLLSNRQIEVLTLISIGRTTKQAALDLGISHKTIETHRANIMERLGIHSIPGLVRYALRYQLIPWE